MIKAEKIDTLVIDTRVLVEFFRNTSLGNIFLHKILLRDSYRYFFISPLVYTELLYIFCRNMGIIKARAMLEDKLKHFFILDEEVLRINAAELKCRFGIALSDCYSIASGQIQECPVLMKREQEFSDLVIGEIQAEIIFIEDLIE